MSRYTNIVLSCLVFLIGIFVFKAIFAALGLTLLFLLATTLAEIAWKFRESKIFLSLANVLMAAILALVIYVLVYLPIEFQITEVWMVVPKISPLISVFVLLVFVFLLSLIDWSKFLKQKFFLLLVLLIIIISGFIYREYRQQKLAREYLPKIYRVTPNWGIQAVLVKIGGVNFGPAFKKGKVVLDGEEMLIRFWDEKSIIAEQQVPTKFGQIDLYLIRNDGIISNKVPFKIRNPDSLTTFWGPK